jgi:hypothetical protein
MIGGRIAGILIIIVLLALLGPGWDTPRKWRWLQELSQGKENDIRTEVI